jgi:predicted alpha/beta-fold hydrolase
MIRSSPQMSNLTEDARGHDVSSHLLVICHGLWGNPQHTGYLARQMQIKYPDLTILNAKTNEGAHTYDGIDWGAKRVVEEIKEIVQNAKGTEHPIKRFSITGYSLGGLIARYVIGILSEEKFFKNITAINFATFATPHLGKRKLTTLHYLH